MIKTGTLSKMNAELDRFVYSVSHDISAPLKSILGLVNISKLTNKEGDHRNYFNLIEKSVNKLEHFVSDVLDYSRNQRTEITEEELHVRALAVEVFDDLKFMNGFNEMRLDLSGITREIISTDKTRLKIILQNLFSNAIKFRQSHIESFIKVSTVQHVGQLILIVSDNGQGISREYLPNIFNMFFRGSDKSHGAGLGLYIAQETARVIGANITVESNVGHGTAFTITFLKF
jgi:signal transduction histidine kinase